MGNNQYAMIIVVLFYVALRVRRMSKSDPTKGFLSQKGISMQDKSSELRERVLTEFKNAYPSCMSYSGGCDGDLIGEEHEPDCPACGKDSPNWFEIAVTQRIKVLELEEQLSRKKQQ